MPHELPEQRAVVLTDFDDSGAEARLLDGADFYFADKQLIGVELALELEYLPHEEFAIAVYEEAAGAEVFYNTGQRSSTVEESGLARDPEAWLGAALTRLSLWARHCLAGDEPRLHSVIRLRLVHPVLQVVAGR